MQPRHPPTTPDRILFSHGYLRHSTIQLYLRPSPLSPSRDAPSLYAPKHAFLSTKSLSPLPSLCRQRRPIPTAVKPRKRRTVTRQHLATKLASYPTATCSLRGELVGLASRERTAGTRKQTARRQRGASLLAQYPFFRPHASAAWLRGGDEVPKRREISGAGGRTIGPAGRCCFTAGGR